jgi:ElaB/YqjD/DUF883 family membrane-anchored ribosome-binding protein
MESILNDNGQAIRGDANIPKPDAAGAEMSTLTADVQDLLGRLAHVADPEIARLRIKVGRALTSTKRVLADGTDQVQRHAKNAMAAGDGYVREQPWQAVGIAAAAGLLVGFLVGRR